MKIHLKAYNILNGPDSEDLIDELSTRLQNGETLSSVEREILYQHIQGQLTDEDMAKVEEVTRYLMEENDDELEDNVKLREYINNNVLTTRANLNEEILFWEMYLFPGNQRPGELREDTVERVAQRSYLDALLNYKGAIDEVPEYIDWDTKVTDPLLARVEYIHFGIYGGNQYSGHGELDTRI